MFNSKKSQYGKSLSTFLRLFLLVIIASPAAAEENYGNLPPDGNMMDMSAMESVDLPFDPNDYDFLIYVPKGGQDSIEEAMSELGIVLDPNNDIRDYENEVTANDLAAHDILIVGWNSGGYTSGLDDETLAAGITGRVILTGHDLDYHTYWDPEPAAPVMLVQAIDWVLKGDGTGMITLGCTDAFPYLPDFWDVTATHVSYGKDVNEFTAEGLASGVYDGLEPEDMSDWGVSYHDIFTIEQGSLFVPFELGGGSGSDIITIASDKIKLPYICKDDNNVDCVSPLISEEEHVWLGTPYNWLYYNIDCNANGHADTNVKITDYLPAEVNYISSSSDPCGLYDPNWHTVTWNIGDMSASDSNTFWIQVAVNYYAKSGHKIINYCEIEGDEYFNFTTEDTNVCCYGGNIIYVDANANGYNNGTSWLDAYEDLQDAFFDANNCGCEQIRVAEGTYKPTDRKVRMISFDLLDDVAVYGGFPPGGGTWFERNPGTYETILSGDIGTPNDLSDNSYHVVKCQDVNNAILDGFTITAGNADASDDPNYRGGGIYNYNSSPTIANCTFSGNLADTGAGICNDSSDPNITNCIFIGNTAYNYGGGMYNRVDSWPTITNCIFYGNQTTDTDGAGGGIGNYNNSSPTIINCTISGNSALNSGTGGGMDNYDNCSPSVTNCTFSGNLAKRGAGVFNHSSDPNITNCIFIGNTAYNYGGGMYNRVGSSPTITNCIFYGNQTTDTDGAGGGIGNYNNSSPTIINCTISGNSALNTGTGGGMDNYENCSPMVTNCIFWANYADGDGNEIHNYSSNPTVSYCDIEDSNGSGGNWDDELGTDIVGNIDEDPCFMDVNTPTGSWTANASYDSSTYQSILTDANASWSVNELAAKFINPDTSQYLQFLIVSNDTNTITVWSDVNSIAEAYDTYEIFDYHLGSNSPCIDAGTNTPIGGLPTTDIDGEPRIANGRVDMGADEYYWSPADFNENEIVNFVDYAMFANAWQTENPDFSLDDDNDVDMNDLALFVEDWLWIAGWTQPAGSMMMGQGMGGGMSQSMGRSLGLAGGLYQTAPAKQQPTEIKPLDIEYIIKWLDEIWLDEEVRKVIDEDKWLKFMESLKEQI